MDVETASEQYLLPPEVDVDQILKSNNAFLLVAAWNTYQHRCAHEDALADLERHIRHLGDTADQPARDLMANDALRDLYRRELRSVAEVSDTQALAAGRYLVDLMASGRWSAMHRAHTRGVTWSDIGRSLGMSKQGAIDWYRRKKK